MLNNKQRFLHGIKILFKCLLILIILIFVIYDTILTIAFEKISLSKNDLYKNTSFGENLQIHMVDVGQGDGFILTIKDKVIVVDTGPMIHKFKMTKYLKSLGVKRINTLIVTHPHQDHFGGLDSILCNFKVDNIYTTDITSEVDTDLIELFHLYQYNYIISKYNLLNKYKKLNSITNENGNPKNFSVDGVTIKFLSPKKTYKNFNNNSIVCKIEYKDVSMLFTGDIEAAAEQDLVDEYGDILDVDILKISHHGSRTSSTEEFINATSPEIGLISCECNNSFWHPHKSVSERLEDKNIKLYRTDENGSVILSTDGHSIEIDKNEGDYKCGAEISMQN